MKRIRAILLTGLLLLAAEACPEEVKETYPGGKPKAQYSVNPHGRKSGKYVEYYKNGNVKLRTSYKSGLLSGKYESFFESGKPHVTVVRYVNSKITGTRTIRDETGVIRDKTTYRSGKLHGTCTKYRTSGKPYVKISFKSGSRDGTYVEYGENGKAVLTAKYRGGKLHGKRTRSDGKRPVAEEIWVDGELRFPKSKKFISERIGEIEKWKPKSGKADPAADGEPPPDDTYAPERLAALKRVMIYRFLCDLPYGHVRLDAGLNASAEAAAKLCKRIGRLDHKPPNPGMPEVEYQAAYFGTSHSNLHMGGGDNFSNSVDSYMADSSGKNVEHVGHRRWILDPRAGKFGFGAGGKFSAMRIMDKSGPQMPGWQKDFDWSIITYHARRYMPTRFIHKDIP